MPSLRDISVITIALACGLAVLAGLVVLAQAITALSRQPADFLPAENTVAVLHNADAALLEQYQPWFPILSTVTPTSTPQTVAIVTLPDESVEVITFRKAPTSSTPKTYWPYTVQTTSNAAGDLLQKRLHPLAKQDGYHQFSRGKNPEETWLFLRPDILPAAATLGTGMVRGLLTQNAHSMSVQQTEPQRVVLELYKPNSDFAVSDQHPVRLGSGGSISFTFGNLHTALQNMWQSQTPTHRIILGSLLRQHLHALLGPNVSGRYDLLPLLQGTVSAAVTSSATGHTLLYLHGTHSDPSVIANGLTHLQQGWRSKQPATEQLEMQLDDRFRLSALRMKEHIPAGGLFLSQNKHRFTITNREAWLQSPPDTMEIPRPNSMIASNLRSSGQLRLQPMATLLQSLLGEEAATVQLPFVPPNTTGLTWVWEERGSLAVLNLHFTR